MKWAHANRKLAVQGTWLLAVLLLAGWLGSLVHQTWPALAITAAVEVVVLLRMTRRLHARIDASRFIPDARYQRLRTRSRRLAKQLRNLRSAAATLPDAAVLLDGEGRVRWFNQASEHLLGLQRPRDRGVVLAERLAYTTLGPWLRKGARQPLNDVSAPNDSQLRLGVVTVPFGQHQRMLVARDISNLLRLQQVRQDFVANVSHELRTPLTVLHGYLDLIDPDQYSELSTIIIEMRLQSRRMGQIVEDLLMLSRLETRQELPEEPVAMAPLLATLMKEAKALSHDRHRIEMDAEDGVDLLGSTHELHSAFSNLLSNAVRYTPAEGCIRVSWKRTAEGACFSVRDSGHGIPANHLERLTERFYRVSSSRSRDSGGTGLGLSIVKHVLNRHDARLKIESEPGHGSTFSCLFNAARVLSSGERHA